MRKIIDIDNELLPKLKLLAAIEDSSVKKVMEDAVFWYLQHKQKNRVAGLSKVQREDLGLLFLMQQADAQSTITEEDLFTS